MTPERILITGGAGFIGSHTADALLAAGKQVVVLDNLSSGKLTHLPLQHPHLEFVEGDVLEFPLVMDLLSSCDAVLHLAAIASVPMSIEEPIYSFQVNTQGFLHVLEAVRKLRRALRIVYASSAAVYGDTTQLPCRDDMPLMAEPLSPYAVQKRETEHYANLYFKLHGIPSLGLRYFNVYGKRQDPHSPYSGVISRFMDGYKQGALLTVYGDGKQSRDFIHVSDIAQANTLALHAGIHGQLNIATGQPETLLNLIKYIEKSGAQPATVRHEAARLGDIQSSYAAVEQAKQQMGFQYQISLQEGVKLLLG